MREVILFVDKIGGRESKCKQSLPQFRICSTSPSPESADIYYVKLI